MDSDRRRPVAARAAPPLPPPPHLLLVAAAAAQGPSSRRALASVLAALPALARSGVSVVALPVRRKDIADLRVLKALEGRHVARLPALLAGGATLVGCQAIEEFCGSGGRLGGDASRGPGGALPADGGADGDAPLDEDEAAAAVLDDYYRGEMGGDRRQDLSSELGGGLDPRA